eukprot:symbB.v1.2.002457.t1/scaffold99.1/size346285/13
MAALKFRLCRTSIPLQVAALLLAICLWQSTFVGPYKEAPRIEERLRMACTACAGGMPNAGYDSELKVIAGNETPVLLHDLPSVIAESDVPSFLAPYGYKAKNATEWFSWKDLPELTLQVCGHTKVDGHMLYDVKCTLAEPGRWHSPYLSWRTLRRLCHLREGLHDRVKQTLGTEYREVFASSPFASSLHLPGTSARLNSWFQKLSACLNRKEMPPFLAAAALQLLGAPDAAEAAARAAMDSPTVGKGLDASPDLTTASTIAASNGATDELEDAGFDIDDLYEEDPKFLELCPDNEGESLNEGGLHSDESAMIS